jgi:hypothetical protein
MKPRLIHKKGSGMVRTAVSMAVALAGLSQAPHAVADTMLLSDTALVRGTSSATFSFDAPTAGMVTATLSNLPWPDSLSTLNFQATSATSTLSSWSALDSADETRTESFAVGPGTYFTHILATAQGQLNLGLYALNVTFSANAVPLPASEWMLFGGVLTLFGMTRAIGLFGRLRPPQGLSSAL